MLPKNTTNDDGYGLKKKKHTHTHAFSPFVPAPEVFGVIRKTVHPFSVHAASLPGAVVGVIAVVSEGVRHQERFG